MRRRAGLLLVLASAAAASAACTLNELLPEAPPDIRRFPRVLVLPFDDRDGLGRLYARSTARGLLALGLSPVPAEQAESLEALGGAPLSAQRLAELKARTGADAVLSARVDCGRPGQGEASASFVLQEAEGGLVVLKGRFTPKRCGSSLDAQPIAAEVCAAFRRELERRAAEGAP